MSPFYFSQVAHIDMSGIHAELKSMQTGLQFLSECSRSLHFQTMPSMQCMVLWQRFYKGFCRFRLVISFEGL